MFDCFRFHALFLFSVEHLGGLLGADGMFQSVYVGNRWQEYESIDVEETLAAIELQSEKHREMLEQGSAISTEVITDRGYRTVTERAELRRPGFWDGATRRRPRPSLKRRRD